MRGVVLLVVGVLLVSLMACQPEASKLVQAERPKGIESSRTFNRPFDDVWNAVLKAWPDLLQRQGSFEILKASRSMQNLICCKAPFTLGEQLKLSPGALMIGKLPWERYRDYDERAHGDVQMKVRVEFPAAPGGTVVKLRIDYASSPMMSLKSNGEVEVKFFQGIEQELQRNGPDEKTGGSA